MDKKEFDVFVIGSGVAGRLVAEKCAKQQLKVAIADNRAFGGTCANRGCDPKKVILGPTEVLELSKNLKGKGIVSLPTLNWKALQKFKRTFTEFIPKAVEDNLEELGIELYHQSPKFIDETTLTVEGKTVSAKKIVIATGNIPRKLDFKGNSLLKTSDDFLNLKKLPKHIIFIGTGYIAMEFAHMAARCGSKVTMLDHNATVLNQFDDDLVSELIDISKQLGIKFVFNAEVVKVKKLKKNFKVQYIKADKKIAIKAQMVINTSGRVPAIATLNLEKGNVAYTNAGISYNHFMQNPLNKNVYSCGDVSAHSKPLAPLSGMEANIVAENIINGNTKKIDTPLVPSVVFTLPNLASVGLNEEEAKKRYKNIIINYKSASDWYNAKRINTKAYAYKILMNKRTNEIVGAHLLGPQAAETINLFAMAISKKMTANDIKGLVFTYPSWCNDIKDML
ncbi:glutathione reductase (NADPH) [Jejuia pallidilutea]|uniref:Glutathione reductase (NADPH) n=1 Tax=Jejuia pallidilutea TaxID=504487 RepID=A0A362X451_9FLAO|nr:NAD(P)/FAD-dependent oxidoreductase [Jejuia pallidilutea]PQV49024.1 glutathione reductase (NADPH) [Jejuia pallidilutea]